MQVGGGRLLRFAFLLGNQENRLIRFDCGVDSRE
jgi:hypothetical protein